MSNSQAGGSGLSAFSARLISDTFDALMQSAATQNERLAEMDALLALSEQEFRNAHIDSSMVDEQMRALFGPGETTDQISAVAPGLIYRAKTNRQEESPAIFRLTGVTIGEGDVSRVAKRLHFTPAGCERIRTAVASALARQSLARLAAVRKHGTSRVAIESGKINVKLVMTISAQSGDKESSATRPFNILVAPVSLSNPSILRSKTNLTAELEIHFKTSQKDQ